MSDEPENLMLVYLRRLDSKMDHLASDMQELKHRMTTLEVQVGQMVSSEMNHYASVSGRLDRIEARLDRLERRADIISA